MRKIVIKAETPKERVYLEQSTIRAIIYGAVIVLVFGMYFAYILMLCLLSK